MKDLQITKDTISPYTSGDICVYTKDNGDIYVGNIDGDGELDLDSKELDKTKSHIFRANIAQALRDLFEDRENCSWTEISDWPKNILKFIEN